MLTRLDDALIDHDKVEAAGELLGKHGYERALGAVCWGLVHANKKLTDGFLPQRALDKYGIGEATAAALVQVRLWEAVDGGFIIHDFHDWNPTAQAVKAKQKHDRERKRKAYGLQEDSARNDSRRNGGLPTDSDSTSNRIPPHAPAGAPAVTGRDGRQGISGFGGLRRHPLDTIDGVNPDPEICERATALLERFSEAHTRLVGDAYPHRPDRDFTPAKTLVATYSDVKLDAIVENYMQATGLKFDGVPKSLGRLLDAAPMIASRIRRDGAA